MVFPDHFVYVQGVGSRAAPSSATLFDLRPGVTEIYVHPAVDTARAAGPRFPDWHARVDDHDLVTTDAGIRTMIERSGAQLVGFRELRDLQRAGG